MAAAKNAVVSVGRARKRPTRAECLKLAASHEQVGGMKRVWAEREPESTGLPCQVDKRLDEGWKYVDGFEGAKRKVLLEMPYDAWKKQNDEEVAEANNRVVRPMDADIAGGDIINVESRTDIKEMSAEELNPNG